MSYFIIIFFFLSSFLVMSAEPETLHSYRIPRSFKLRVELDMAEKGIHFGESKDKPKPKSVHEQWITFGIHDANFDEKKMDPKSLESQLQWWNGTIIGPQNTNLGDRIYALKIIAGSKYPEAAPEIYFVNKITVESGVDPTTGKVNPALLKPAFKWTPDKNLFDYLCAIRDTMPAAAKLKQPAPEAVYPNPQGFPL